uniref:Uncharacterized protein n=1 Tax=Setaria viridis TaxID=4556 RepID=A0A4U6TCW8_SETVI|nr:hypothetical protein SEVIR_8G076400v2 [Setaria viridis]
MATTRSGKMRAVFLVAAAMFVVIVSCTLFSTTYARCDLIPGGICSEENCHVEYCGKLYGQEHRYEKVYCLKTPPFPDQCCCEVKVGSPPPSGHHPSPPKSSSKPGVDVK